MRPKARIFSVSANLDSLLAGAMGFIIIQILARYSGIGVSPDSVTYISSARHLLQGKGLTSFDGLPLVDFPAGYPFFMAFLSFISRHDILFFGAITNGLMFAGLIYLCGSLMNGFTYHSHWYKWIILGCLVTSPCLLEIYSLLWSETLFLILMIGFIPVYRKYMDTHALKWLLLSAVIVAAGCITRYAGVMMIGAGCLLILLDREIKWPKKISHGFLFCVVSASLLMANLLRNRSVMGTVTGARQKAIKSLFENAIDFGGVISDWLSIDRTNGLSLLLTIFSFAAFVIAVYWLYRRSKRIHAYEYISAVIGLLYCSFMLFSASVSRYEQFTNRLLSPMFIPLLWTVSFRFPPIISRGSKKRRLTGSVMAAILTFLFIPVQISADIETYDGVKDAGIPGYREDPFPQSDIVLWLEKNKPLFKPGYIIYSNAGDAVYFFSGMTGQILPQLVFPKEVEAYYHEPHNYLVWFNDVDNPDLVNRKTILQHKKMNLVVLLQDGSVYETADSAVSQPK